MTLNTRRLALAATACFAAAIAAQTDVARLPDPLVMADGTRVTSAAQWRNQRRPELQAQITYLYSLTTATDQKIGRDAIERYAVLRKALDARIAQLNRILGTEK